MMLFRCLALGMLLYAGTAAAQADAAATRADLAAMAAKRFPQPVRVGDLVGRQVLQPAESQPVLGRVEAIIRRADGTFDVVMRYGGLFGLGGRAIAVPVEGMALLGEYVAAVGFTPEQLRGFPTIAGWGSKAAAADTVIRMGLVRPFH